MLREHAPLTPSQTSARDEHSSSLISEDSIHVSPKEQRQQQQQQLQHHAHQHGSIFTDPANCCPQAASSREARSISGSSTGLYSISRGVNWDSAMSSSSYPAEPVPTPPALNAAHADASRAEAGLISESYKEGHARLSWAAEVSLSDGRHSRSAHDVPNTVTVYAADDKERELSREPNAVLVLLLFSTPIPFFSICTSLYTLFALLLVVFTTPLRLCPPAAFFRSTTFSAQLCKLLAPALRNHERLAQSSTSDYHHSSSPYSNNTHSATAQHFSAVWLFTVLTLAPFLCIGLLLAVWIAAFFWIFAMILGNPDGTENGDDGRAAVLGVNAWWQTWLNKSRMS